MYVLKIVFSFQKHAYKQTFNTHYNIYYRYKHIMKKMLLLFL